MAADSTSSCLGLMISLVALGVFGYSTYFMNYDENLKKMSSIIPEPLRRYGHLKFLTYQCLLIQLASSLLHILAHFIRPLRGLRDLVFTCFAYPVGSCVVYTFWAVWHGMGRELIFPVQLSQYYPDWLNHATHTVIVPLNLLLCVTVRHRYLKLGPAITLLYFALYTALLFYIRAEAGVFVYRYLDTMSDVERIIYFSGTGFFAYLMNKSGQLISNYRFGGGGRGESQATSGGKKSSLKMN